MAGEGETQCRELQLAQQLFLLQTNDAPGDKAALKAALLVDICSNGTFALSGVCLVSTCVRARAGPHARASRTHVPRARSRAAVCAVLRASGLGA
jgi:hypothetical protein